MAGWTDNVAYRDNIIAHALSDLERPVPTVPLPGEPPSDGRPVRRGLRRAPRSQACEPLLDIEELPAMIARLTAEYLATPMPGYALLLALPPGSGKTTQMVALAESAAAAGQRVLYAGPRHDFFSDVLSLASRPLWWYEWQPRTLGNDQQQPTCRWAPQIERWQMRGYRAVDFCSNARVCGWHYMNHQCPYHAQRRITQPIVFVQHQHIALRHPLMEQAALLIGDELPLGAFLHPWLIPRGAIVVDGAEHAVEQLLWTLRALTAEPAPSKTHGGDGSWSGPHLLAALGGASHIRDVCEQAHIAADAVALAPTLRSPDAVDEIDYFHLPTLLSLLKREAEAHLVGATDYVRRVRVSMDGLTLLLRRRAGPLPPHVIWSDATGDTRLYERLIGMPVQVARPQVQMAGRVYQVWASLNNKMSLSGGGQSDEMKRACERKRADITAQIARIIERGAYERPAIISYKALVDTFAGEYERGHFGAERGTNRLESCDCLIVVGAPQPPQQQLLDMAAMLYDDRMTAFDTAWSVRDMPYATQEWAWPIGGFWDDPDLQTLLEQVRDAELLQAVHRVRPLRRNVDVWLLTNTPIDGLPVELVSLHVLFDAPEGVDPYIWPALRAWVQERMMAVGRCSAPEIAAFVGVQLAAARRYAEALMAQDGYDLIRIPGEGRGRPPLTLVKDYQKKNIDLSPKIKS